MSVSVEQFVGYLRQSGLMSADEIHLVQQTLLSQHSPQYGEQLAEELIRRKKLTQYQATVLCRGRPEELVLGNYIVLALIAQGGMGHVFKAQHRRMERIVALKELPAEAMRSAEAVDRFLEEVKLAAKLIHPNIVTAYDADEANGIHFLVMEYVNGCNLAALVKQQGNLCLQDAVHCILQTARGLDYAHTQGIVHRDIKPSNLLLDRQGIVKILDLGLAHSHPSLTRTPCEMSSKELVPLLGKVTGTADYMAPEQALSIEHTDQRSDIYSLGCTFYHLLTGSPPYAGNSLMEKLLAHRQHPIPSLRRLRPDIPPQLDLLFHKMVAKNPQDRYQIVPDVIRDLQVWEGDEESINRLDFELAQVTQTRASEGTLDPACGHPDLDTVTDVNKCVPLGDPRSVSVNNSSVNNSSVNDSSVVISQLDGERMRIRLHGSWQQWQVVYATVLESLGQSGADVTCDMVLTVPRPASPQKALQPSLTPADLQEALRRQGLHVVVES